MEMKIPRHSMYRHRTADQARSGLGGQWGGIYAIHGVFGIHKTTSARQMRRLGSPFSLLPSAWNDPKL